MLYRLRIYQIVPENLDAFTDFFLTHLLPLQLKYGARLVGRWVTEDNDRILVVWEYDSRHDYVRIDGVVRADSQSVEAQRHLRDDLPRLYDEREELLMTSTVSLALTLLGSSAR